MGQNLIFTSFFNKTTAVENMASTENNLITSFVKHYQQTIRKKSKE